MSNTPNRRDANREATRALIIAKAREAFAARGYAEAQLSEIVAAAGVTTGAIYHHFRDKKGLFLAVAENVEHEILAGVVNAAADAAAKGQDLWGQFTAGLDATLSICAEPDVQRIVFVDAPTVIGPAAWRQVEMRFAFGAMNQTLDALARAGIIRANDPPMLASVLLGALIEAAGAVARAEDKPAALAEARTIMANLLGAVRA